MKKEGKFVVMMRLKVGDKVFRFSGESPRIKEEGEVIEVLRNPLFIKDQVVRVCFCEDGEEENTDLKRSEIVFASSGQVRQMLT